LIIFFSLNLRWLQRRQYDRLRPLHHLGMPGTISCVHWQENKARISPWLLPLTQSKTQTWSLGQAASFSTDLLKLVGTHFSTFNLFVCCFFRLFPSVGCWICWGFDAKMMTLIRGQDRRGGPRRQKRLRGCALRPTLGGVFMDCLAHLLSQPTSSSRTRQPRRTASPASPRRLEIVCLHVCMLF
jgi:hypothetical protein